MWIIWGCVSGDSEIHISSKNEDNCIYGYTTFESLWDDLENNKIKHTGIKEQPAGPDYLYCDPEDLSVYDMNVDRHVKVLRVVKNKTTKWKKITFASLDGAKELKCTYDHPLPIIGRGRIRADEVSVGDMILIEKPRTNSLTGQIIYATDASYYGKGRLSPVIIRGKVESIEDIEEDGYSYDVTTETDKFTVNHIDSHNCRAFLSPYYERGGFYPADGDDRPIFTGRWNGGVVSLHLPMILAKSRQENKDFYEVLDYYLELIRGIHKRTKDYLGELRASTNPLQYCEGGFYRGNLKPSDKIKPLLDYVTFSYGITALNELNRLYNGKSIREDGEFPLEVMKYINKKIEEFKKEDHILYAIYGSPKICGCLYSNI